LRRAKVYAVANQKGGVGKTTTAVNVSACLAEAGERVLLIDLDPQANATSGLGMRANGASTHDLLDGVPLPELAKPSGVTNLDVVMAKSDLAAAGVELSTREGGEKYLADALADALEPYSYVLLEAANRAIVPVQAEYYALEGLSQLLGTINLVKARLNPELAVTGILLTMADGRTRLTAEVETELRSHFGSLVFTTTIPRSIRLAEAPSHGVPAIAYDRRSAGAEAYWKVAMELVERS
jgi:chromosome partitioning protein